MFKLTLANLLARKVRLIMSTISIVLGIGFLTGVMTFSHGLGSTFDNIVKGSTPDAQIRAIGTKAFGREEGSAAQTLPRSLVTKLQQLPQVAAAHGQVNGSGLFLIGKDRKLVGGTGAPTIGTNHTGANNMLGKPALVLESGAWPTAPDEVNLDANAAKKGGYQLGDLVTLVVPYGRTPTEQLRLVGTSNFAGGGTAGATLVLFSDQGAQQTFLQGKDAFNTISLQARPGVTQQQLVDAVKPLLPAGFTAVTGDTIVAESQSAIGRFLSVISTFLLVFAAIAILVGGFIIANTFSILVAQRVRELALLRAIGASRRQVTRSVLLEAMMMALIGAGFGLVVGLLLARALASLFSSFGLDIAASVLTLTRGTVTAGFATALVVTLASAYFPARRAAKVAPVAAMRDDQVVQEGSLRRRSILGTVAFALGTLLAVAGLLGAPGNDAVWIGAGAGIWVLTAAVLAPVLGRPVLVACRALFARVFGTTGQLASENALRNPRRTGATASALMIGLAVVSAVGVLAASLNATYDKLINDQFRADFLVQSPTFEGFPTALGDEMAAVPGVGIVSRQQAARVTIGGKEDSVMGTEATLTKIYPLDLVSGTLSMTGNQAIVTDSTAKDRKLTVGSSLALTFPGSHTETVKVVGIFKNTPVTLGINVPMSVLAEAGVKRSDNVLNIDVAPGADKATVKAGLKRVIAPLPIVTVQDKEEFRATAKSQINQLLYIIYGLLALAIIIAIFGIVNTLGLSVVERTREIGLLRAVGMPRSKLRRMVGLESVVIALLGAVLGMALGLLVGVLLRQSLSSDITSLALPLGQLVVFLVLAIVVGVLASLAPAWRASRMRVLDAIAHPE